MYSTPYCQIQHLKEKNAILCTWKQFCKGEEYQEPFPLMDEILGQKEALGAFFEVTLMEEFLLS